MSVNVVLPVIVVEYSKVKSGLTVTLTPFIVRVAFSEREPLIVTSLLFKIALFCGDAIFIVGFVVSTLNWTDFAISVFQIYPLRNNTKYELHLE